MSRLESALFTVLVLLCLIPSVVIAATVTRYVRTDSDGGNGTADTTTGVNAAYVSMAAWDAAEATSLTVDGDSHVVNVRGGADNTDVTIAATDWVTGPTNTLTIQQNAVDAHAGVWDATKYNKTGNFPLTVNVGWTDVIGLQLHCNSASNNRYALKFVNATGGQTVRDNILRGSNAARYGLNSSAVSSSGMTIYNNIAYDFQGNASNGYGFYTYTGEIQVILMDNNTVVDSIIGYAGGTNDGIWTNNAAFGVSTDGFSGNWSTGGSDYNLSDFTGDNVGANGVITTQSGSALFSSYAGDNFGILDAGSDLAAAGTDLSGTFTTDITGTTRSGTWDIGAFEFTAAGGARRVIIISNLDRETLGLCRRRI